jgi:hypothetical protein
VKIRVFISGYKIRIRFLQEAAEVAEVSLTVLSVVCPPRSLRASVRIPKNPDFPGRTFRFACGRLLPSWSFHHHAKRPRSHARPPLHPRVHAGTRADGHDSASSWRPPAAPRVPRTRSRGACTSCRARRSKRCGPNTWPPSTPAGRAKPGYQYSPNPLPADWAARAKDVGVGIFKHKGIGREEADKRRAHDRENFRFFGAQQVFFLGTQESAFSHGTFLDCGFVLDNLMLGLVALGLGSCPQFSVMMYPDLLKKHIPDSADTLFIAALPFGRPKPGSRVNEFQPPACRWTRGSRSAIEQQWFKGNVEA